MSSLAMALLWPRHYMVLLTFSDHAKAKSAVLKGKEEHYEEASHAQLPEKSKPAPSGIDLLLQITAMQHDTQMMTRV